jgi:hypothetical protein
MGQMGKNKGGREDGTEGGREERTEGGGPGVGVVCEGYVVETFRQKRPHRHVPLPEQGLQGLAAEGGLEGGRAGGRGGGRQA